MGLKNDIFSQREKALGIIAIALLAVFAVAGYVSAQTATPAMNGGTVITSTPQNNPEQKPQQNDDSANHARYLSDQQRWVKDIRREINDIKKSVKNLDTSAAEGSINKFDACLQSLPPVSSPDFGTKSQECSDVSQTMNDEMNTLRPKRQCQDFANNMQNRRKELKSNVESQIKDIKRNDKTFDASALDSKKTEIDGLIAKLEQASATCNADNINDLNSMQRDVDDAFKDWYDLSNDVRQKSDQSRQLNDSRRHFEKDIKRQCDKDFAREMKGFEKDLARIQKQGFNSTAAETAYGKVKDLVNQLCTVDIQAMQKALDASDNDSFNDASRDFDTNQRDFWDLMNEARQELNNQQQSKDALRDLDRRVKDFERMKKEYERASQKGQKEIPSVKKAFDDYEALINKAKNAIQTDPQSYFQDYNQQLNDLQNEFWNSQQQVQSTLDAARWLNDIKNEIKIHENDVKNMSRDRSIDPETIKTLSGVVQQLRDLVAKVEGELVTDPQSAQNDLQTIDDIHSQWEEATRSISDSRQQLFALDQAQREIEFGIHNVQKLLREKKISQSEADTCLSLINEVKQKVEDAKKNGTPTEDFSQYEESGQQACPFLEDLGNAPPADRAYYNQFIQQNSVGIDKNFAAQIVATVSDDVVSRVMQRLLSDPTLVQNLLQAAGKDRQGLAASTLEAASNFYDESAQKQLLAKKAQLLALTDQLSQLKKLIKVTQRKLSDLQAIQNEISAYNFYGNSGNEIQNDVQSFIAKAQTQGLSAEEVQAGIDDLKVKKDAAIAASKEAKVEARIIPFRDTEDTDWFTKYVAPLAQAGIVQGGGDGNFYPSANVTISQIITMAFRISRDDEVNGSSALCNGKYAGHWANKFLAWAETKNLSILSSGCIDIDRPALRWEVAQILLEIGKGKVAGNSNVCFDDVQPTNQPVNSVVCGARDAGIMSGTNGLAHPYDKVLRAQAATMVKQAAEKLFGTHFGQSAQAAQNGNAEAQQQVTSSAASPQRSRCWYDEKCTDMVSSQLVSEEQCRDALGGKGFGPDQNNCKAL